MIVRTAFVRDIRSSTPGFRAASAARRCFVGAEGAGTTPSYWLDQRGHQLRQTFEIKSPADQVRLLANAIEPSAAEATQPVLTLPKELLDLLSASLRELVAEAPPSHPDARMRALAPAVDGDVWGDPPGQQGFDERGGEEALVGPEGRGPEAQAALRSVQQAEAARGFRGRRAKDFRAEAEENSVAILHERIHRVAGVGAGAGRSLRDKPTIRIAYRAVRGIAPLFAAEVNGAVAGVRRSLGIRAILRPQPALVFLRGQRDFDRHETVVAGVGPDERAVGADVPTHQPLGHRPIHRRVEQSLQDAGLVEAPPAILTERRGVPRLLVEVEPHKPAQRHVALQLHHELPVAGDAQEVAADQRQEQLLGRNRRPPDGRVEITTGAADRAVRDEGANRAERMVRGHEGFQRDVVEERPLRIRRSHHRWAPPLLHTTAAPRWRVQQNHLESTLSAAC